MGYLPRSDVSEPNLELSSLNAGLPQLGTPPAHLALVVAGLLGAIIWDILSNINADYRIIHEFPISVATMVYLLSRISTLAAFILFTVVETQDVSDCGYMLYMVSWMAALSISSTSFLFFMRVRAVYANNKYVVAFFGMSWLAVVGECVFETQNGGKKTQPLSPGASCVDHPNLNFISLVTSMTTVPMVNDTLIFLAMTWRLMQNTHVKLNLRNSIRVIIWGRYLPAFSRALLKEGHVYFLSTVSLSIVSTVVFYSPHIPRVYKTSMVYPNLALMNLMGCRLFRNTKLGLRNLPEAESGDTGQSQPMAFA